MIKTHIFKFIALFTIVLGVSLGTPTQAVTTELATTTISETSGYNHPDVYFNRVKMVVNQDGYPIFAYVDSNYDMVVEACTDAGCTDSVVTKVFDSSAYHIYYFDLVIAPDNTPVLAISTDLSLLYVVRCSTETCSLSGYRGIAVPDSYDGYSLVGTNVEVVVGADNKPVILPPDLYREQNGETVHHRGLIKCTTTDCSESRLALVFSVPSEADDLTRASLALGSNDFAAVGYAVENDTTAHIFSCSNADCTSTTDKATIENLSTIGNNMVLTSAPDESLVLAVDTYEDNTIDDITLIRCQKKDCSRIKTTPDINFGTDDGLILYDVVVHSTNRPILAVMSADQDAIGLIECTDSTCQNYTTQAVQSFDDDDYLAVDAAVGVGNNGALMVGYTIDKKTYFATTKRVKTVDYTFSINEIGSTLKTADVHPFDMVIGKDGKPIIAYYRYAGDDQKTMQVAVAVCSDASCTDGEVYIVDPTTRGTNSSYTGSISIVLGQDGNPVIVYSAQGKNSDDLFVAKCNDRKCCDATITTLLSAGKFNHPNDVIVPADGKPVITYSTTGGFLKLIKCASADCSTFNESYTINDDFVSADISMVIGGIGHPAVVYITNANSVYNINLYTCGDDDCSADEAKNSLINENTSNTGIGDVSAVQGKDGNTFIAYRVSTGQGSSKDRTHIKMIKCLNTDCSSFSDIMIDEAGTADSSTAGLYPAITVTADNRPLISYANRDETTGKHNLALAQCVNAQCSSNTITIIATLNTGNSFFSTISLGKDQTPVINYQHPDTKLIYHAKGKR